MGWNYFCHQYTLHKFLTFCDIYIYQFRLIPNNWTIGNTIFSSQICYFIIFVVVKDISQGYNYVYYPKSSWNAYIVRIYAYTCIIIAKYVVVKIENKVWFIFDYIYITAFSIVFASTHTGVWCQEQIFLFNKLIHICLNTFIEWTNVIVFTN